MLTLSSEAQSEVRFEKELREIRKISVLLEAKLGRTEKNLRRCLANKKSRAQSRMRMVSAFFSILYLFILNSNEQFQVTRLHTLNIQYIVQNSEQ